MTFEFAERKKGERWKANRGIIGSGLLAWFRQPHHPAWLRLYIAHGVESHRVFVLHSMQLLVGANRPMSEGYLFWERQAISLEKVYAGAKVVACQHCLNFSLAEQEVRFELDTIKPAL